MKKRFAKLIAISSILFLATGCGEQTSSVAENSSVVNPSSDDSTVVTDSSVALPAVTIKAAKDSYTIEKGGSTTIRFTVTSTAAKTLTFAVEQDKEIVTIPEDVAAGISVTVTGKAIGKATLVATSTVNPNSVARVSIEVVRPIAPLQSVWNKVIGFDNYTLDITRTPTNTELAEHDDWTEETAVPVSKVKTTVDSIIYEVAGEVGDDLTTTYGPAYHSTQTGNSILGAAIDKNGYAFYLQQTAAGEYVTAGEVIKTSAGLLNSTNFKGAGVNATSPNGISDFFGLQAVNPSWLTAEKASSNVYELGGDDDKGGNPDFAECVLWQLVDPNGFMETVQSGVTSFADIADKVDVTITCTASDNLTISVDTNSVVYNVALTAVGTTAELTGLETFLANSVATLPALSADLVLAQEAIATGNYYEVNNTNYGQYKTYYFNDYVFFDYTDEYIAGYIAKNPGKTLARGGVALIGDSMYEFTVNGTDVVLEDEPAATYNPDFETLYGVTLQDWFHINFDFYTGTATFDLTSGLLYTFSELTAGDGTKFYHSTSKEVSDDLVSTFFGNSQYTLDYVCSAMGYTLDSYSTSIVVNKKTTTDGEGQNVTTVASIELQFGSFTADGQSNRAYGTDLYFGVETVNPIHEAIEAAIDAKAA